MAGTTNDCNALGVRRNLVVILAADVTVPLVALQFLKVERHLDFAAKF